MDTNQPAAQPVLAATSATPGIFGTKIPSSVAFVIGVLLFFMPFAEIKCSGTTFAHKSGLDIAMRKDWKAFSSGTMGKEGMGDMTSKANSQEKGNSWIYAIAALGLGVLGLLFSIANAKTGGRAALVAGILSAGALIGMMLDIKQEFNRQVANDMANKTQEGADTLGLNKLGNSLNDIKPTLVFTSWFYVAVIAFLAAAFFCYKRMQAVKL